MPTRLSCGTCLGCRRKQAQDWSVRMYHENQSHHDACFLTLTYGDDSLPDTGSLDKEHPTNFLKRLRKVTPHFRYYLVGEYGDTNNRPHYHAILYGFAFPDRNEWMQRNDQPMFRSKLLESKWGHGYSTIQHVTPGSIRYVAKYVQKKLGAVKDYERHDSTTGETWEVLPEYAVMSRRPGIGHEWFHRYYRDIYPSDFLIMDGRKYKPPLYYDRLLEKLDPELLLRVKKKRRDYEPSDPYANCSHRLAVSETIAKSFEKQSTRPL